MGIEHAKARIRKVKEDHESQLLALPGVIGVGIGEITDRQGRRQPCIRIYVEKRDDETLHRLPKSIEEFLTDIREVGKPQLL
jgi:hypothetical protein